MFTVKLVDEQGQEEYIEASGVSLVIPERAMAVTGSPNVGYPKELLITHDGGVTHVSAGVAYVMNANGKTVGKHLFSMPPGVDYMNSERSFR